jgi:hypothetical protein
VNDERIDPERLAAFLDGTASPEEREGVLRTLARSPTAYADFLEASAIHRELTGDSEATVPIELAAPPAAMGSASREARRRWFLAPLVLAAAVVAVMVIRKPATDATGPDAIQLAQTTSLTRDRGSGSLARALGADWDRPPWSVVRGADSPLASRPLAFRAGARYAQLEMATQTADSTEVGRATEAIAQLVGTVEAGAAVAARFRDLARRPEFGGSTSRAQTARQTRALLGEPDWFDLGTWAETARLSLSARNVGFFAPDSPATRELRRIVGPHVDGKSSADAAWVPVVDAIRPLRSARSWSPNDIPVLDQIVRAVIAAAAE